MTSGHQKIIASRHNRGDQAVGGIVSGTGTPKMTIFSWVSGLAVRRH